MRIWTCQRRCTAVVLACGAMAAGLAAPRAACGQTVAPEPVAPPQLAFEPPDLPPHAGGAPAGGAPAGGVPAGGAPGASAAVPLAADALAEPAEPLVRLALARHPSLRQARAAVDFAAGMRRQATRPPNPTIGYTASEIGNEGSAGQQGAFIGQEFVTAGKRRLAGQVYSWQAASAEGIRKTQQLRVATGVRLAYWRWVAARRTLALLEELSELQAQTLSATQQLHEAGELAMPPVLQARVEAGRTRSLISAARRSVDAAERSVAVAIGVPAHELPPLSDASWTPLPSLDWSVWPAIEEASPELAAAGAAIERARWAVQQAQAQVVPNVDTQFTLQHNTAADELLGGVQLGVALPIYDRKRGLVAAARAELSRAAADLQRRRLSLQDRLVEQLRQYNAAIDQLRITEAELLPAVDENLQSLQVAFQQGEATYLELLTVQRSLLEVRQSAIDLRLQATSSLILIDGYLVSDPLLAPETPGGF